jgi:hypothetical protein
VRERVNQDAVYFEVLKKLLYVVYGFLCCSRVVAFLDGGEQDHDFFDAVLFLLRLFGYADFLLNRLVNKIVGM